MTGVNAFHANVLRYEQWFREHPHAYESELAAVRSLLPQSGRCVEIGVGTGLFASPLGIRLGVEPSRPMAGLARSRGVDVIAGVAEHLPLQDNEFDCVLMVTTVCFLDDRDLAFREAWRVLRQGGAFVIGFVDRESALGRNYLARKDASVFYKDATFFSAGEVAGGLKRSGFSDLTFRQTLFGPLDAMKSADAVREGHGEGSFVVVRGIKREAGAAA